MIDTTRFPYEKFPYRLEYKEGKIPKICFFECKEHLDKYMERYSLKKRQVNIEINKGKGKGRSKK